MTARSPCGPPVSIPSCVRAEIADLFNLPLGRVRVIVPYLGGGFGSKSYTKMEPITAALSWKAQRPGEDSEQRRGLDADQPPPRDALPNEDHGDEGVGSCSRAACGSGLTQGPTPTTGRACVRPPATQRPAPTAGRPCTSTQAASTRTRPPPAPIAPSARSICSGSASCRSTGWRARRASTRSRCGAETSCGPAKPCAPTAAASRWTPTWWATSRRPPRLWPGPSRRATGPDVASPSACWPPEPIACSRAPTCAWRPTGAWRSTSGPRRWARARAL